MGRGRAGGDFCDSHDFFLPYVGFMQDLFLQRNPLFCFSSRLICSMSLSCTFSLGFCFCFFRSSPSRARTADYLPTPSKLGLNFSPKSSMLSRIQLTGLLRSLSRCPRGRHFRIDKPLLVFPPLYHTNTNANRLASVKVAGDRIVHEYAFISKEYARSATTNTYNTLNIYEIFIKSCRTNLLCISSIPQYLCNLV